MPTRKLKVFQAQFGFFDTVLAAPSQAAALGRGERRSKSVCDGTRKGGGAGEGGDLRRLGPGPGTLLRRAVGSNEPFTLEPTSLPRQFPDAPKATPASTRPPPSKMKPKAEPVQRPPADRSRLDAAEAALGELDGPAQAGRGRSASPAGGTRRQADGRAATLCRCAQEGHRSRGRCPRSRKAGGID